MKNRIVVAVIKASEPILTFKVIDDSLEAYQKIVRGSIESVPLSGTPLAGMWMFCNDSGKLEGLAPNFTLYDDVICGDVVVTGVNGPENISLNYLQVIKIIETFSSCKVKWEDREEIFELSEIDTYAMEKATSTHLEEIMKNLKRRMENAEVVVTTREDFENMKASGMDLSEYEIINADEIK